MRFRSRLLIFQFAVILVFCMNCSSTAFAGMPKKKRRPTSTFAGFKLMKKKCPVYGAPASSGETLFEIKRSRKIWVESYSDDWFLVYRKVGVGFITKSCF